MVDYQKARAVLRERRFELRMRVRDLAEKAEVERTTIYHLEKIEKEPGHEPDFKTIEKLASAMGFSMSEFFARLEGVPAPVREIPRDDNLEAIAARFADAVAKRWSRPDDELAAAATTVEDPAAHEALRSALARAASAVLAEKRQQQKTAAIARNRPPKGGRHDAATGKRKRAS